MHTKLDDLARLFVGKGHTPLITSWAWLLRDNYDMAMTVNPEDWKRIEEMFLLAKEVLDET